MVGIQIPTIFGPLDSVCRTSSKNGSKKGARTWDSRTLESWTLESQLGHWIPQAYERSYNPPPPPI